MAPLSGSLDRLFRSSSPPVAPLTISLLPQLFIKETCTFLMRTIVVCNFGVQFDSNLKMEHQIANAVKNVYYQIRNTGRIQPHLTKESYKTLGHSLVTSLLNCGNALLCGLPQTALQRLQNVQNCVARFITRTRKHEHITSVLQRLRWLPVYIGCLFTLAACLHWLPVYTGCLFTLATLSFGTNFKSTFVYLLCFKCSGAGLPG